MTAVLPAACAAPPNTSRTADTTVGICADCGHPVIEIRPGIYAHLADACRECFDTAAACPDPQEHGSAACPAAEALHCGWCHRMLEAAVAPCPDHRDPCCGCCQPG